MEDTYLPAFRAAVTEGQAASIMCAYNRINGQPACANTFLLEDQLRDAWKFNGYVVSDCDAIVDIFNGHHFTKSMPEAVAAAIKTGMDNECADFFTQAKNDSDYRPYVDAVKQGLLSEKDLDLSLKRLFTARFKLGMFDPPEMVAYARTPDSEIDSDAHRALALKAAQESIVLLKNDGVLPLNSSVKKIAVVGALAESTRCCTATTVVRLHAPLRRSMAFAGNSFCPCELYTGHELSASEELIPSTALSTDDGQPGLKGEYFPGIDFEGAPQLVRVDKAIDLQRFHPERSSIAPPRRMKDFSVRWTGFLRPRNPASIALETLAP